MYLLFVSPLGTVQLSCKSFKKKGVCAGTAAVVLGSKGASRELRCPGAGLGAAYVGGQAGRVLADPETVRPGRPRAPGPGPT